MLYSILIYGDEATFGQLPEAEQEAALEKHRDLQAAHRQAATLGPVARL